MKKRILASALCGTLLAASLTACGGGKAAETTPEAAEASKEEKETTGRSGRPGGDARDGGGKPARHHRGTDGQ